MAEDTKFTYHKKPRRRQLPYWI